jgi:hypothetical protein
MAQSFKATIMALGKAIRIFLGNRVVLNLGSIGKVPSMSNDLPVYTTIRLLPFTYQSAIEMIGKLKSKNKRWSMSRLINFAMWKFIQDAPSMTLEDIDYLFSRYDSCLKGEKDNA